jgi:hypothetical protein
MLAAAGVSCAIERAGGLLYVIAPAKEVADGQGRTGARGARGAGEPGGMLPGARPRANGLIV